MAENSILGFKTQLPLGFADYKVLTNDRNDVEDVILLDVNAAFEKITGLENDTIVGKKIAQLQTDTDSLNWVGDFSDVAVTGIHRESNILISQRWYKVTAFSTEKNCFGTMLQDITPEIMQIEELTKQKREIEKAASDMELILYSAPGAMFLVEHNNGKFRFVRSNEVHQKITGFPQSFVKGKTPIDIMGPKIGKTWLSYYTQCVSTGNQVVFEESVDFKGTEGDWLVSLAPVKTDGVITHLVGSRISIAEVKTLRRQNDELLQRLQSMFNEHLAVMLIIEPYSGKIINANPSACDFYGYTKDELLRLNIKDINMMPQAEVDRLRLRALRQKQDYFLFPHRLKNGMIRMVDVYSSPVSYGNEALLFSIIFDVTDREQYKEALFREKKLLGVTLNSIGDGVVTTDNEGRLTTLNKAAQQITGWPEEDARGHLFSDVFILKNEDTGIDVENPIAKVLQTGRIIGLANHTVLVSRQNVAIPIADSAAPILDESGQCYGVVMVFRDISTETEQQKKILYLSYHDELTGLYNRRYIENKMQLLDHPSHLPLSVIMGDVNGLKVTNDVFGHIAGDKLLQKVAEILQGSCREGDILARWGGDEFLMLLPETGAEKAQQIIRQLESRLKESNVETIQISVSLGCNVKTQDNQALQAVLQKAEELMYHQKLLDRQSYRNNIISTLLATLYEKSMETEEHVRRLKTYCCAIAEALSFTPGELNDLSLLSILHDIGKVGIHMEILQKPGPLTPDEWGEMRLHPEIGYRILQNTPELSSLSDYILSHHERWDGKGYPRGLKGEQIPLFCRILAVADSFDAMTNDRGLQKSHQPGSGHRRIGCQQRDAVRSRHCGFVYSVVGQTGIAIKKYCDRTPESYKRHIVTCPSRPPGWGSGLLQPCCIPRW